MDIVSKIIVFILFVIGGALTVGLVLGTILNRFDPVGDGSRAFFGFIWGAVFGAIASGIIAIYLFRKEQN